MQIFDELNREIFRKQFGGELSNEEKAQMKQLFMRAGVSEEEAEEMLSKLHVIRPGMECSHVHTVNVSQLVEQAIYKQNSQSITIKVSKHGDEETYDGHIDIEVLGIEEGDSTGFYEPYEPDDFNPVDAEDL